MQDRRALERAVHERLLLVLPNLKRFRVLGNVPAILNLATLATLQDDHRSQGGQEEHAAERDGRDDGDREALRLPAGGGELGGGLGSLGTCWVRDG